MTTLVHPCECESSLCPEEHAIEREGDDMFPRVCQHEATHYTIWTKECLACWTAKPDEFKSLRHDWHPDDDVIACDACGVRTYSDAAKRPCPGAGRSPV